VRFLGFSLANFLKAGAVAAAAVLLMAQSELRRIAPPSTPIAPAQPQPYAAPRALGPQAPYQQAPAMRAPAQDFQPAQQDQIVAPPPMAGPPPGYVAPPLPLPPVDSLPPEPASAMMAAPQPMPMQQAPMPQAPQFAGTANFQVVERGPYAELRFSGLGLRAARQNSQLNEVALDFDRPISAGLFERLEGAVPEWVEFSYSGYDSAVIRARRPARFDTRADGDGFSLRISARDGAPTAAVPGGSVDLAAQQARVQAIYGDTVGARQQLDTLRRAEPGNPFALRTRGSVEAGVGDWQAAQRYYAIAQAERPQDSSLRGSLEEAARQNGPMISEGLEYRNSKGQTVVASTLKGKMPMTPDFAIEAGITGAHGKGDAVPNLAGVSSAQRSWSFSGVLGAIYHIPGGDDARLDALYSPAGFGAEFGYMSRTPISEFGATLTYHAPYLQTAESIVNKAFTDQAQMRWAQRIMRGLWGEIAARGTRYGVNKSDEAGVTAGFTASLRYLWEFYGWTAGLSYEVDGEYVVSSKPRVDPFGNSFIPLGITEREIHALSGSASTPLGEDFWLDAYAGFAYDRYGGSGPFGGLSVRYTPLPGFDISAGVSHSSVASHQGEGGGSATTAGLNLVYKMQGGPAL